jgi:hypothetical protein
MRSGSVWFVTGCLLALVAAAPVYSQSLGYTTERAAKRADPSALEAQARSLHDQPKQYRRAAELYLQASELRAPAEPQHVNDRKMAAQLFYYAGNVTRARGVMEQAAEGALAAGDVVHAAHLYLDASIMSRDDGAASDANRLANKADLLMKSPLVSATDKREVLNRIVKR